jgi:RNA polymerase sigma-70 factor, ECF subfamily
MAPEPNDSELMLRLQAGEDGALNQLMTRWQTPLIRFIYRYVGNPDEAADLAQETFVRVYQNRHAYRAKAKFSSWLFTIASNLCRNYARWERRHPTVSITGENEAKDATETYPSPERNPHDTAVHNDLAAKVREAIQSLPHDLKTVVLLFEYEELSYDEIGEVLGCSSKAVETRLYRARKLLQDKLQALGL